MACHGAGRVAAESTVEGIHQRAWPKLEPCHPPSRDVDKHVALGISQRGKGQKEQERCNVLGRPKAATSEISHHRGSLSQS